MTVLEYVLYAVSFLLAVAAASSPWVPSLFERRIQLDYAAIGALGLFAAVRWVLVGHPPVFGTFENSIASTWAVLVFLLLNDLGRVGPESGLFRRLMGGWVPLTLVYGLFFRLERLPLTISERSLWIDVHVLLAWIAYVIMVSGCTAAIARLVEREPQSHRHLEASVVRGAGMGFAFFSGVIAVGAFYSYQLFAVFFKWELVLVLSVATWLGLALVVHARLLFGWVGKKLAWSMALLLPLIVASYWAWSLYANTYHFFDIVPVKAF